MSPDAPASSTPAASLPAGPSLELLRRRAKALLRAARAGDAAALERCRSAVPRLAGRPRRRAASRRAAARRRPARRRPRAGRPSWPRLKRQIEERQPISFQASALPRRRPRRALATARRLLDAAPGDRAASARMPPLPRRGGRARGPARGAAGAGDGAGRPGAAGRRCSSPAARPSSPSRPARREATCRCAELLLDGGASPGEHTLWRAARSRPAS